MGAWYTSWFRTTPELRQISRPRTALVAYGFLVLHLFRDPGDRVAFWFTLTIALLGGVSLLQLAMQSDSLWLDRLALLLGGLVALLGSWLTGAYLLAGIGIPILLICVADVALQRR
jgi:hypothetical protein